MGFFFLLRRLEFLAMGSKHHQYAIRRSDVSLKYSSEYLSSLARTATRVSIKFSGSKNDQGGEGATRVLTRSGSCWCCLVKVMQFLVSHHISIGADQDGLFCQGSKSLSLQAQALTRALKAAARNAGETTQSTVFIRCKVVERQ